MSAGDRYIDALTRINEGQSRAEQAAAVGKGRVWGQTLAGLGNLAVTVPAQQAARERLKLETDEAKDRRAERERQQQEQQQIQQAVQSANGDMDIAIANISRVNPVLASDLRTKKMDADTKAFQFKNQQFQAKKNELDFMANLFGAAKDEDDYEHAKYTALQAGIDISTVPPYSPETVDHFNRIILSAKERLEQNKPTEPKVFNLGAGGKLVDATGAVIAENPSSGGAAGFTLSPGQTRYGADGQAVASVPDRPKATGGGGGTLAAPDVALVESVMKNPGIYSTLTPTARTKIAPELSKRGFDFSAQGGGKPATGAQNKVLGFFNRAKQADDDLKSIEGDIVKMGTMEQGRMKFAPNWMQTQTGQLYNQAQRAFTEARLRKDSGAAIPESEFANDRRTYFVEPGDSAATIEQKNRARAAVLASLGYEAGPALRGFYGEDADDLVAGYREASKMGTKNAKTADPLGIR